VPGLDSSDNEPGAPSATLYFPEKYRSDILSTILMSTNRNLSKSGPPASFLTGTAIKAHMEMFGIDRDTASYWIRSASDAV
jgi:hypothetical protein